MFCPMCGKKIPDESKFCMECGFKLDFKNNSNVKVDSNVGGVKTHNFNYSDRVSFNISDSLTDKTEVKNLPISSFDHISYKYSDGFICYLEAWRAYGNRDEIEKRQNSAYFEECGNYSTSQGYDSYIFKEGSFNETYEVLIDLKCLSIVDVDGREEKFNYFYATFPSLDEAKIFIDTFKINMRFVK